MNLTKTTIQQNCSHEEIFLYLESELSSEAELSLEKHLSQCESCLAEFNSQKELFQALTVAFDERDELELPKDFTKIVVANAESNVKSLRSSKERYKAIFICCALFLVLAIGFGAETERVFIALGEFGRQIMAVASFIAHLIYDISFGIVVILRSLSQQIIVSPIFSLILIAGLAVITFIVLSRFRLKFSRS